jgi:hypothetical protein
VNGFTRLLERDAAANIGDGGVDIGVLAPLSHWQQSQWRWRQLDEEDAIANRFS